MGGGRGGELQVAAVLEAPGRAHQVAIEPAPEDRERALDAYTRARELATVAPRVSLDPAATVFQLGGILASVTDPPLP